jgi:sphinganine-1-phosphate aldolase
VLEFMRATAAHQDAPARAGRISGSIYHGGESHFAFLGQVSTLFSHMNVLQRDMYPAATRFEAEVIAMTAGLLHGDDHACGVTTSGGTESIVTAVLAYRDAAQPRTAEPPELVIPTTAHPAFEKAGHYLGVRVVKVPVDADGRADVEAMRAAVSARTIALVGSAGDYPYGGIDDIAALGQVALEHGIGLHVDACLGGFILPWIERLGADVRQFDFRVAGVTSISVDTHKYGYAPKGNSVVLYRDAGLKHAQRFASPDWPGGRYATPGMAGSRSHGQIAATWAAMVTLGEPGYLEVAAAIRDAALTVRAGVDQEASLELIGHSHFIAAFRSDTVDVYLVNDRLADAGWRMNVLQRPPALHFCVTLPNTELGIAEALVGDIGVAVRFADEHRGQVARTAARYAAGGGR